MNETPFAVNPETQLTPEKNAFLESGLFDATDSVLLHRLDRLQSREDCIGYQRIIQERVTEDGRSAHPQVPEKPSDFNQVELGLRTGLALFTERHPALTTTLGIEPGKSSSEFTRTYYAAQTAVNAAKALAGIK